MSDEDIYNREFSIGYLINSNLDIELFQMLDDLVLILLLLDLDI